MPKLIGLVLVPNEQTQRQVIEAVLEYVRREPSLAVATYGGAPYLPWDQLPGFRGDGLLAMAHTRVAVQRLVRTRLPVINLSSQIDQVELPSVWTDDAAVGRLAAEHLLERGLKNIACVYYPRWANDRKRLASLRAAVEQAGGRLTPIAVSFLGSVKHVETQLPLTNMAKLVRGLGRLKWPVGIFATHDDLAVASVEALKTLGANMPYDAMVLGIGNDRLFCVACNPALSSITHSSERIGNAAAAALHRLLRGEELVERHLRLPPSGIVVRRSTDALATQDGLVAEAVHQMKLRAGEPFTIEQLASLVCVSRSNLYRRFVDALGHTPTEELRRVRLARAETLLNTTDMTLPRVAMECGFSSPAAFSRAFREVIGVPPLQYRKRHAPPSA